MQKSWLPRCVLDLCLLLDLTFFKRNLEQVSNIHTGFQTSTFVFLTGDSSTVSDDPLRFCGVLALEFEASVEPLTVSLSFASTSILLEEFWEGDSAAGGAAFFRLNGPDLDVPAPSTSGMSEYSLDFLKRT